MSVEPKAGEHWYFLIGDAIICDEGEIVNITENTATIKKTNSVLYSSQVYARSKIEFVEKINRVSNSNYLCDND